MSASSTTDEQKRITYTGKPNQLISYKEKVSKDKEWVKKNAKFFIDRAAFGKYNLAKPGTPNAVNEEIALDVQTLYNVYNNKLPDKIFDYVNNPLSSDNPEYQGLPARIRMYNIIRPNVDLFIGEWNKRPFLYDVVNVDGDDVVNTAEMYRTKTFRDHTEQGFVNTLNDLYSQQGQDTGMPTQELPSPKSVITELNLSYKDAKALRGYRSLKVLESELHLREEWRKLFKDWLIAGQEYTIKFPLQGNLFYTRLSSMHVDCDQSNISPYVEDGEWAVARFRVSVSEIVEMFYDELKEKDINLLEDYAGMGISSRAFNAVAYINNNEPRQDADKTDLYLVTWKSKKEIGFLTYPDPLTGEMQEAVVDESYKVDKELGETIEWKWVNEAWWSWRAGDDLYLGGEPLPFQRSDLANPSMCKLPINGKRFSDTEGVSTSVVSLGLAYQILFIVLMFRLEHTIAKSRGKIALMDRNVIPDDEDGGEEGFFWYIDAMQFALIDPKKGSTLFNQYTVLDLSLYDYIKEITTILDYVRGQWDELLGISRQRKGQTTSSDGLGLSEQAIFRSTVISDLIFTGHEEFLERELQGLLDISKYAWVDGKKASYRNDEGRMEMLALDGEDHASSSYGVFVKNMSAYIEKFNQLKSNVNALAQRKDVKVSTVIDVTMTDSLTELKAMVKRSEAAEAEMIQKQAQSEGERQAAMEQSQREHEQFMQMLQLDFMHQQEDRLDNREYIKAELTPAEGGATLDPNEVEKQSTARLNRLEQTRVEQQKLAQDDKWISLERDKIKSQEKIAKEKNKVALKNKVAGEK